MTLQLSIVNVIVVVVWSGFFIISPKILISPKSFSTQYSTLIFIVVSKIVVAALFKIVADPIDPSSTCFSTVAICPSISISYLLLFKSFYKNLEKLIYTQLNKISKH